MPKIINHPLSKTKIKHLKDGSYSDGNNLYFILRGNSQTWIFRYKSSITGKLRMMGLGAYPIVSLSKARELAKQNKKIVQKGLDPLHEKQLSLLKNQSYQKTLKEVSIIFIDEKAQQWKGKKTKKETEALLQKYIFPFFKNKQIKLITSDDILNFLKKIWKTKTKTGVKLLGILNRIFKYAIARNWFFGQNPAQWKGFLENLLPKPSSITTINHRKAYNWKKISKLYNSLCKKNTPANLSARFICLTACRSAEVREMTIDEVNFKKSIWEIPATRNKTYNKRRIPLSNEALSIIKKSIQNNKTKYIFEHNCKPIYDTAVLQAVKIAAQDQQMTVHGLRSTFRDWGSESTEMQSEVLEMALGHTIKSKVERAYRRGDLFEKRYKLMNAWAKHCKG